MICYPDADADADAAAATTTTTTTTTTFDADAADAATNTTTAADAETMNIDESVPAAAVAPGDADEQVDRVVIADESSLIAEIDLQTAPEAVRGA